MGLKSSLRNCLGVKQKKSDLKFIIDCCYTFALAYFRIKASLGKLYMFQSEKLEDLAWDSIAEIFERNESDKLCILYEYFQSADIEKQDEPWLRSHLRRLVFTKVEDHIFKAAGESDPSLKKIIRNLKLAIRDQAHTGLVSYCDGYIFTGRHNGQKLPQMPSEFMQIKLCSRLQEKMQIPDILNAVVGILDNQHSYQKRFSLVALAIIVREVYVHFHSENEAAYTKPIAENELLYTEFEHFLDRSVKAIRFKVGYKYLEKGKINLKFLDAYTKAAKHIVREHFISPNHEISHFEFLREEMPGLEYEHFREKHRPVLEYLVKRIRTDVVHIYRNEWS